MPYFDDLFKRLKLEPRVVLNVIYLQSGLKSFPLADRLGDGYDSRSLESLRNTFKLYRDAIDRPDIVWLVGGWGSAKYVALLLLLTMLRRRFWVFTDAPVPEGRNQVIWYRAVRRWLIGYWFRGATGIIGTGRMAVERLRLMGADSAKLCPLPYPLDETRFQIGKDFRYGGDAAVVVVCSGRLNVRDKRFDLALRAFARVHDHVNCVLRIAGSGPDETQLKRLAQELGIAEAVDFTGWMDQAGLATLYGSGDVYLHTSDFEPYGVTVVEALYSGLYVVASDGVGAALELVKPGVNGQLFKVGDLDGLSAALIEAIHEVRNGNLRKIAIREASMTWNMETYVKTMLHDVCGLN